MRDYHAGAQSGTRRAEPDDEQSSACGLAYQDLALLESDDLRPVRVQLELIKPERYLREHAIRSTVVVLGSARIRSAEEACRRIAQLEERRAAGEAVSDLTLRRARRDLQYARYAEEARTFAYTVSKRFQQEGRRDFVVVTGGGPGIMEAANRGAFEAGEHSIGLNILLPHEQHANDFVTPELCFRFRYFAVRKMHFLIRAKALVAFPGGYGTLDELFEVLTLIQTGKIERIPVVLVGSQFWERTIDFRYLEGEGMVDRADLALFHVVDTADAAIGVLRRFYGGQPPR